MEVKKWTFDAEGWGVRSGMGAYFLSRGLGETTQSFFDGETGFVLESDHDAAMKAKDDENAKLNGWYSAASLEIMKLKGVARERDDEIKRLRRALSDKTCELSIERNTPKSAAEVRLKDEIGSLKESERKANALMREMQDEIKRLKEASKQWGLEPSASDIVDEIARRLRG